MGIFRLIHQGRLWYGVLYVFILTQLFFAQASASIVTNTSTTQRSAVQVPPPPADIQLDSRLPVQTLQNHAGFTNTNTKFGSRLDFSVYPQYGVVKSGTDGVFHDNEASYIVGLSPTGKHKTFIFHMGQANAALGDSYVTNEHWIEGLNTTRWVGDAADGEGMHIIVDIIDTFRGEPGCTAIALCSEAVKDDTVPVFIIGISLQNSSTHPLSGKFVFGSNRQLPVANACLTHTTPLGTPVNTLSYSAGSDATGGTLFLAGASARWNCQTTARDRAGLNWSYAVGPSQTQTAYLLLGGWNASQNLFINTHLAPTSCQSEGLYAAQEWTSEQNVVDFAMDNLSSHDNLLGQAQVMENYLIANPILTTAQRWLIGDTLRSYKANSWLMGRQGCAGGGYDAAVYEGSYGFLSTVDVMHEYGYFEITRIPWFFKSALTTVFQNAVNNSYGLYFQHDQGADVDSSGNCTDPGKGIPTFRSTCYVPPKVSIGTPMPTEENDNVALLMAYYEFVTGDTPFLQQHITQIDAAMAHNIAVGDSGTGIAAQDTATTYDAASDCLHNNASGSGNLYYQGLKEATGYRATTYLDGLIAGDNNGLTWTNAATKIEKAMVQEYNSNGFLPIANSNAFTNCNGRTVALGEGLFYLHLIGRDTLMNQTLLSDLAKQYPADLNADTLASPAMIVMTSTSATGPQCSTGHCHRYEWFSKVILSGIIADTVYTHYGCTACTHVNVVEAAYLYNLNFNNNFGDGFHDDNSDWTGHNYPRGIISWAFLSMSY